MAKQPKKPTAKAAKTPAAKKTAKPKPAAKAVAKKAKTAAKAPATKKTPVAKLTAAKKTAKKAVKKPTTAKTAKTVAKKPKAGVGSGVVALTAPLPATPTIGSPANGASVPANADLQVSVGTNRTDLDYTITVTDTTANPPVVVKTLPVTGPVTDPFMVTVPGNVLPPGRTYRIKVTTNPAAGHGSDTIDVTTTSAGGGGGTPIED